MNLTGIVGRLELDATGAISQASGATLAVGALKGAAATMTLSEANTIGTLGAFAAAGAVVLNDTGPLVVAGPVSGTGRRTVLGRHHGHPRADCRRARPRSRLTVAGRSGGRAGEGQECGFRRKRHVLTT